MYRWLVEWWKDTRAMRRLEDQFWSVTGQPGLFTREDGRKFRKTGLTPHEYISGGWRNAQSPD